MPSSPAIRSALARLSPVKHGYFDAALAQEPHHRRRGGSERIGDGGQASERSAVGHVHDRLPFALQRDPVADVHGADQGLVTVANLSGPVEAPRVDRDYRRGLQFAGHVQWRPWTPRQ